MKKSILFLQSVVVVLLLSACSTTPGYQIQGISTSSAFDGKTVYLKDAYDNNLLLDSTVVADGKFYFADTARVDVPKVLMLSIHTSEGGLDYRLPVVLENGVIEATMGEVVKTTGTKLNDKMQDFLLAVDAYSATCTDKSVEEIKSGFAELLKKHILDNKESMVGVYIFKSYTSALMDEQRQAIEKEAGEWFGQQVK